MAAAMQNTITLSTLDVAPWVSSARGESANASSRRPRRPLVTAVIEDDHEHRDEEQQVVEALVRREVPSTDRDLGAGRREAQGGEPEHPVACVEDLLEQDAEAERRQREVHPRHPHRRNGDERAHGNGDQRREHAAPATRASRPGRRSARTPPHRPPRTRDGTARSARSASRAIRATGTGSRR